MTVTKLRAADCGEVKDLLPRRSPEPVQHPHLWVSLLVGWHRGATEIHTPSVPREKLELWVQGQTPVKWGRMVNPAHIYNSEAQMHPSAEFAWSNFTTFRHAGPRGMHDLTIYKVHAKKNEATELQNNAP